MSDVHGMPPASGRRALRWLKLALGVSLALNLLVAGLIAGAILGRSDGPGDAPELRVMGLAPFAIALPREARNDLRRRIEADAPTLLRERAEIGRGIRQVQQALRAEPFDSTEVARALTRSRAAAAALQARAHAALLETLGEMSPADRAIVADRLGRAMRRMADRDR